MDFNFTEEQRLLAETVQRFLREEYSFQARHKILQSQEGWSREVWRSLAGLGLTGLNVPERYGGIGAGPVETMLTMNALGAALVLEPYLGAAVLAPIALARALAEAPADTEHARLLSAIADGERIAILAHQEPGSRGELRRVDTRARRHGDSFLIDGHKSVIAHGGTADVLLISARTHGAPDEADGISLFRVDPGARGLQRRSYRTFDGQQAADIDLHAVEVPADSLIGASGGAYAALQAAHDVALSALCAEAVGIMQATNEATLEYTKSRKQFGQPIARFQVLQHRMVDMFIHAEQATSMSYLAAIKCLDPDPRERRRALAAAKTLIGQAGRYVGQQAIQLHGGMGMTDELMVSHYFKRLTAIDLTWGDTDFHTQRFIESWEAPWGSLPG